MLPDHLQGDLQPLDQPGSGSPPEPPWVFPDQIIWLLFNIPVSNGCHGAVKGAEPLWLP